MRGDCGKNRLPSPGLTEVASALEKGLAQPRPNTGDSEAAVTATYEEIFEAHLTAAEIGCLKSSTALREDGLRLCRHGDLQRGALLVSQARHMIQRGSLGAEAAQVAESFLLAAESYVCYKSGRYDDARELSLRAVLECGELHDAYRYPVEGRRIHLVRNVARIDLQGGNYRRSAALTTSLLILLVSNAPQSWPHPELDCAMTADAVAVEPRWALLDQTLEVVALLAQRAPAEHSQRIAHEFGVLEANPHTFDSFFSRSRHLLAATSAYARRADHEFLAGCTEFFTPGPAYLPITFRQMANLLANAAPGIAVGAGRASASDALR